MLSEYSALHSLKHQDVLLSLLFQTLYNHPSRPPAITEGLLGGILASNFGTIQYYRDVIDSNPECSLLQARIRDTNLLIALDSLCLSTIVESPQHTNDDDDDGMFDEPIVHSTILGSKDSIQGITLLLNEKSQDLSSERPEIGGKGVAGWPIAVLCLGFAIVLRSLPEEMLPSKVH
jgi:hypothetical protein